MKGAVIDETVVIEKDTAKVGQSNTEKEFTAAEIDTVYLQSNCDSLKSQKPEIKKKAVQKIQEEVCPDVSEDVLLSIPVTIEDSTYTINVKATLYAHGGTLKINLSNDPINIQYTKKTVTQELKPDKSKDFHKYLLGFVAGIVLLALIFIFKR
jgi:hypothetical protein